jgi:hypothetical protein
MVEDEARRCAEGDFYVTGAAETDGLAPLRRLAESSHPGDPLLAAVTHRGKACYGEVVAVYERLCGRAPKNRIYQAGRAALYEQAGRKEDVRKARAEAEKAGYVWLKDNKAPSPANPG